MEQKVKNIILEKLGLSEDEYRIDANIKNDWGCDSLDIVELVMECEREFSISIPDNVVEYIRTPKDLISYIKEHIK